MSGPIVRKYGFPNYDAIFGSKEIQHGIDDEGEGEGGDDAGTSASSKPKAAKATKKAPAAKKTTKKKAKD